MRLPKTKIFVIFVVLFGIVSLANGQKISPAPPPPPPPEEGQTIQAPPVQMIKAGEFAISGCRILKKEKRIEFPAVVNMNEGLLEYLLVENSGKVHESLLRTEISPYAIQIAMLLLGIEGSTDPLAAQGENKIPEGDRVTILLKWNDKGKERTVPIDEWITMNNNVASAIPWVFTGSVVSDGIFLAQIEKSIIAVYHDPTSLIDHQMAEGGNDEIWKVNSSRVPDKGTGVTVVIEKK